MSVVSKNVLLEAGVHFGHQTKRWNPKMKPYIYGARDDIYIIDLDKTVEGMEKAYAELKSIAENGGTFLFVGTKKQAGEVVKEEAARSNSYYVTERWLGGTLTNFRTIRRRVNRLEEIEKMEKDGVFEVLPKKEVIGLKKEYDKLNRLLSGIRNMVKLPHDVDYVIPGNDDAVKAIKVVLGALNNAICEANGLEMVDYTVEEPSIKEEKKEKKAEVKEAFEKKEEVKEETVDYSKMTLTELKAVAKEKGIKGYSSMKKDELIQELVK